MNGAPLSSPGIPPPLDDDDDDVAWALQTAAVQWKRGASADAMVWLRRAVDAAIQAGRRDRASELNGVAALLTEQMFAQAQPAAPAVPVAPVPPWPPPGHEAPPPRAPMPTSVEVDLDGLSGEVAVPPEALEPAPVEGESPPPVVLPPEPLSHAAPERQEAEALAPASDPLPRQDLLGPASAAPDVGGVSLAGVRGLEDLPEDAQQTLAEAARLETLQTDEEVGAFGVGLVVRGWVHIMPAIADAACARAGVGDVVFTAGTLGEAVALRAVAGEDDTVVAVWDPEALQQVTAACPWVADELRLVADRYQALAGATLGELGERLDDALRATVTDRCEVRTLLPGETILQQGEPVTGIHILGAGCIEIVEGDGGEVKDELGPGDFLFSSQVMAAGPAPATARAGQDGALMLFADRHVAHELMVSVPLLLEILAG